MVLIFLLLSFGFLSLARTSEWSTDLSLWAAAVREGPLMPRSHLCLGLAHKDRALAGNASAWAPAKEGFARCLDLAAVRHDAGMGSRCVNNLGSVAFTLGRLDEAERRFREALAMVPDYDDALANLGSVYLTQAQRSGDMALLEDAIGIYRRVLELRPTHAQTWGNLATALEVVGDLDGAQRAQAQRDELLP